MRTRSGIQCFDQTDASPWVILPHAYPSPLRRYDNVCVDTCVVVFIDLFHFLLFEVSTLVGADDMFGEMSKVTPGYLGFRRRPQRQPFFDLLGTELCV